MNDQLDDLYEELAYYADLLLKTANDAAAIATQQHIEALTREIKEVESLGSRWG